MQIIVVTVAVVINTVDVTENVLVTGKPRGVKKILVIFQ
jgi:hypothetical protein